MIKKTLVAAALLLGLAACQTTPDTQGQPLPLEGSWHVESILGQPTIDYSPAQLVFADDGKLSGNNSCNNFFGTYSLEGQKLKLVPAGSTMKACVDALMAQEQLVMQVLPQVVKGEIQDGKLLLLGSDERVLMQLSSL
ncbi:META domain-containing protein [Shewanella carassii]|nr:META domain-containing protein [Shewanella carassii]